MARSWSRRARRDFDERRDYRRRNDEEDRYKKRGAGSNDDRTEEREDTRSPEEMERDAREDRREERGWADDADDYENYLMQLRNASPDEDVNEALDRLRERRDWYESELDRYDADYDDAMAEIERLRRENQRYMMRDTARNDGEEADDRQRKDIRQDNDAEKGIDDLWDEREG